MGYDADVPYTIFIFQNVNDFTDLLHSGHFPSTPEVSFKILPYIVATEEAPAQKAMFRLYKAF
jgi:hypothetical protein